MDARQNFFALQIQFFEIFKAQDPESEDLDIVFDIGGKKLYANKSRLTVVSPTFKSMLAKRWTSKNDEPIQINEYKFNDFEEFLSFIYSGECKLTNDNIFAMVDLAEFYGVQILKNACDQFLTTMELTWENVFPIMELSNKYSLVQATNSIQAFLVSDFDDILKCEAFLDSKKSIVEDFVALVQTNVKQELIFQAVYEWSKHQAIKKQNETIQENFSLNDAIKIEINPFLPYIKLNEMSLGFLVKYVVKRSFLFSDDELSNILDQKIPSYKVKVTNSDGESIFGTLPYDSEVIEVIESLKNRYPDNDYYSSIFWNTKCEIPSTPSPIMNGYDVEWYLIYDSNGDIGVSHQGDIDDDHYLLAEMTDESSEFVVTEDCKIEIFFNFFYVF